MKLTVCELTHNWTMDTQEQDGLFSHLNKNKSDFLLLPEMPFYKWLAGSQAVDSKAWEKAVQSHAQWIDQLSSFNVPVIAGTRPVIKNNRFHNEGFVWTKAAGAMGIHEKYYLPDEPGFWEATWYQRGDGVFEIGKVNNIAIGFLICTELWFNARAREYGKAGMDILLCPRATPKSSSSTWVAGGQAAANVSGAFCVSSNFKGPNIPGMDFGGTAWIVEPEEGEILGTTTEAAPFLTLKIDLDEAKSAKQSYPRYVKD
ncbi:MAG: carbon-nitrogen hydrolase family protein [Desulfobacter sp.]|nr:carbon-nitrogen hydrolase family protein [Desulfobacter sp.]WDP85803.1 MAG: carbon-nitrogen hydrolase family protein [Desulfobacter sp.]